LQQLFTIGNVSVTYSVAGGTAVCDGRYKHTSYFRLSVTFHTCPVLTPSCTVPRPPPPRLMSATRSTSSS
jgi:hypothetical protein